MEPKSTLELPLFPLCLGPQDKRVIPATGLLALVPAEPCPVVGTMCGSPLL